MTWRGAAAALSLVVAAALLLALVPGAYASVPDTIVRNADEVTAYLYQGGGQGASQTPTCVRVCSDLWLEEHRPMPNQPSSYSLHRELRLLRWRAGLTAAFRTLPAIGLGVASFEIGWTIGTFTRGLLFGDEAPAKPAEAGGLTIRMVPVSMGDTLVGGSSTYWSYQVIAPTDGYKLVGFPDSGAWAMNPDPDPNCELIFGSPPPAPEGFEVVASTGQGSARCSAPTVYTMFRSSRARAPTILPPNTALPETTPPNSSLNPGSGTPSFAAVGDALLREFNERPEDYPTLLPYLDNRLGGDSEDPIFNVRLAGSVCLDATAAACEDTLTEMGFEAVEVHTLDFNHAATGILGGRVTALYSVPRGIVIPTFDPATVTVPEDYPVLPIGTTVPAPLPATIPSPSATRTVPLQRTIIIIVNPAPEDMPTRVLMPLPHETYDEYAARALGRNYTTRRQDLTADLLDPARGPNEAVRTDPTGRVRQETNVTVMTNPPDAPVPGGAPTCGPWVEPSINLAPLNYSPILVTFPFGVPMWLYDGLSEWIVTPTAPSFTFPFPLAESETPRIDLAIFDPFMPLWRSTVLVVSLMLLAWSFFGRLLGGGGDD